MRTGSEKTAVVGFAVSLAILASLVALSFRELRRLDEASHEAQRSNEVIAHLELLVSYLKDAESGQRGYLLTGREAYLAPYDVAVAMVPHEVRALRDVTAGLPREHRRLDSLEQLIGAELIELRSPVAVRRKGGLPAAERIIRRDRAKQLMEVIHRRTARMRMVHARRSRDRERVRVEASRLSAWWVAIASALAFALLGAATFALQLLGRRRERTVEALRDSEECLRLAVEAANIGAWDWDVESGRITWSPELETLAGIPPGSFGGTYEAFCAFIRADDRAPVERALARTLETGAEYDVEMRLRRPDGTERWVRAKGRAQRANDGRPTRMAGVTIDVSEAKRAAAEREDLLARAEAARTEAESAAARRLAAQDIIAAATSHLDLDDLLRTLIARLTAALHADTANVLLLTEDGAQLRVRASHGMEEEPRPELLVPVGRGVAGRIAASREPLLVDDLSTVEVVSEPLRKRTTSLVGVPLLAEGRLIGVLHVGTSTPRRFGVDDVMLLEVVAAQVASAIEHARLYEAERHARAEEEAANRAKDEFLGNLSHELRSPLSAIRTWVHLLRRGKLDEEKATRALATIEESAKLQAGLIEDLLDVSRIVSGKLRMDARPVDLAAVVEAAADTVRLAADAKEITLVSSIDPIAGEVTGDAGRLQQVVWNLLANALKFTPRGGRVEVHLERDRDDAVIRVRDTGEGIGLDFLPHVFQRFRQADTSSTRRHGGLGLGLAIVRHVVELHGGAVAAESPGAGEGATFFVRLPLTVARAALGAPPLDAARLPAELGRLHVLIVDDDPSTAEALAAVLEESGAIVTTALSAAEGLAAFRRARPAVIVSDIAMPGEDGYTLIRRLRALEYGLPHTPAVALTAYAGADDRARALDAGYDLHLAKPVDPPALIAAVAEVVHRVGATAAAPRVPRTGSRGDEAVERGF